MQFSVFFSITMLLSLGQAAPAGVNNVAKQPIVAREMIEDSVSEVKRAVGSGIEHELSRRQVGLSPNAGKVCTGNNGLKGVCDNLDVCRTKVNNKLANPRFGGYVIGSCPR